MIKHLLGWSGQWIHMIFEKIKKCVNFYFFLLSSTVLVGLEPLYTILSIESCQISTFLIIIKTDFRYTSYLFRSVQTPGADGRRQLALRRELDLTAFYRQLPVLSYVVITERNVFPHPITVLDVAATEVDWCSKQCRHTHTSSQWCQLKKK